MVNCTGSLGSLTLRFGWFLSVLQRASLCGFYTRSRAYAAIFLYKYCILPRKLDIESVVYLRGLTLTRVNYFIFLMFIFMNRTVIHKYDKLNLANPGLVNDLSVQNFTIVLNFISFLPFISPTQTWHERSLLTSNHFTQSMVHRQYQNSVVRK